MRTASLALSAAAATGMAVLAAAPALAQGGQVTVTPSSATPGQTVMVVATGCITTSSNAIPRAYSDAFPMIVLSAASGTVPTVSGSGSVFANARPGTYRVTVMCDSASNTVSGTGTVVVTGATATPTTTTAATTTATTATPTVQTTATPTGGAATGDGASQAATLASTIGVTAVVLGGIGFGALTLRRGGRSRK